MRRLIEEFCSVTPFESSYVTILAITMTNAATRLALTMAPLIAELGRLFACPAVSVALLTVERADEIDEGVVVVVRRLLDVTGPTEEGDVPFRGPLTEGEALP